MELYLIIVSYLYFVHKGLVDFKMYSNDKGEEAIREKYWYLRNDHTYLGGTLVMFFAISLVSFFAEISFGDFLLCLSIGILIGSQTWDMIFGGILYRDPFHPFFKWYENWGFDGNRTFRYVFDCGRVGLAIFLTITLFL